MTIKWNYTRWKNGILYKKKLFRIYKWDGLTEIKNLLNKRGNNRTKIENRVARMNGKPA